MKWISVKEKLPPDDIEVLTYPGWAAGESKVTIDRWMSNYKCFLMCIEDGHEITHWMPLPEPPHDQTKG